MGRAPCAPAPHPRGTDTATARGAGAPGTQTLGRGAPPAAGPGPPGAEAAGGTEWHWAGARLVAASPLPSCRTEEEDWGPATGEDGGGASPRMRPREDSPAPSRGGERAPASRETLINKLQSGGQGAGSVGRDSPRPPRPPSRSSPCGSVRASPCGGRAPAGCADGPVRGAAPGGEAARAGGGGPASGRRCVRARPPAARVHGAAPGPDRPGSSPGGLH